MSGKASKEVDELKGFSKHFNSTTIRGRANVAIFTYICLAAVGGYFYFKPKKNAAN